MSTETITRPDQQTQTGSGTPRHRHYFRPPDDWPGEGQTFASYAIVHGLEISALCGYKYVPDTEARGLPVCPACVEVAANILTGGS